MRKITHLVQFFLFRVHEIHDFVESVIKVVNDYLTKDPGGDRPEIEMLQSVQNQLSTYLDILKADNNELGKALNNPRKSLLSENISNLSKNRQIIFGDIKRSVRIQYNELKSEASIVILNEIGVIKNLNNKPMEEVSSILSVFINKMKTKEYKAHCTTLNLSNLLKKLEDTNTELKNLIEKRKLEHDMTVYSSVPSRKKCKISYYNLIDYANSLVMVDTSTNYDELVVNLNSLINPMNKEIRSRVNKSKKEENPSDRPEIEIEKIVNSLKE